MVDQLPVSAEAWRVEVDLGARRLDWPVPSLAVAPSVRESAVAPIERVSAVGDRHQFVYFGRTWKPVRQPNVDPAAAKVTNALFALDALDEPVASCAVGSSWVGHRDMLNR